MAGSRSEDTLLFIGITPKIIKLKKIYKLLNEFAEKKQSIDLSDRFNVILFDKNGPIYFNDFTFNFENVLELIKDQEKSLVRANIAGGIFIACTFIIDVFKKISGKSFRLIILTDKGSHKIPGHYVAVLIDLLDKVKGMPFFIDIIRIATDDPEEDLTLMKIANRCNGDLYEVSNPKELGHVLNVLAEKKSLPDQPFYEKASKSLITDENKEFFEHLAQDPKILITLETCSICFKKDDRTVVECPNCKIKAHMDCWAHWAKSKNIGIPNVFRCHQCFNILKLDKDFVKIVQTGATPPPEWEEPKVNLVDYLQDLESKNKPEKVQVQDPLSVPEETTEVFEEEVLSFSEEDVIDLQEIPANNLNNIQSQSDNLVPTPSLEPIQEEKVDPTPVVKKRREKGVNIVFCPSCSKITTSNNKYCPNCGFPLY